MVVAQQVGWDWSQHEMACSLSREGMSCKVTGRPRVSAQGHPARFTDLTPEPMLLIAATSRPTRSPLACASCWNVGHSQDRPPDAAGGLSRCPLTANTFAPFVLRDHPGAHAPGSPVSCFLFPVSCFLFPVSCFLFPVSCFLFPVSCFLFPISCFLSPVSYLLFPISCFLSPVSYLLPNTHSQQTDLDRPQTPG
ncbi:hypothetical protein Mal4_01030 [Maioricimonas rarisocia]|uniref:Uncharacterized protein n=1 Tax=Maioricimonas rarisocia TaxID=2528026 RepID=A0A517Z008_9PLAN|nr:hypothetical protein Mal4_01030 [Maioricimonas rarisocia]